VPPAVDGGSGLARVGPRRRSRMASRSSLSHRTASSPRLSRCRPRTPGTTPSRRCEACSPARQNHSVGRGLRQIIQVAELHEARHHRERTQGGRIAAGMSRGVEGTGLVLRRADPLDALVALPSNRASRAYAYRGVFEPTPTRRGRRRPPRSRHGAPHRARRGSPTLDQLRSVNDLRHRARSIPRFVLR
jgi:hypothetical protein